MTAATVLCACGCGTTMSSTDTRGRARRYAVRGHNRGMLGRRHTDEAKRKMSEAKRGHLVSLETREKIAETKRGAKNAAWKGDGAGYMAIHVWLLRNCSKTGVCQDCGQKGRTEWANVSGLYHRGADDYQELCTKCHRRFDRNRNLKG